MVLHQKKSKENFYIHNYIEKEAYYANVHNMENLLFLKPYMKRCILTLETSFQTFSLKFINLDNQQYS